MKHWNDGTWKDEYPVFQCCVVFASPDFRAHVAMGEQMEFSKLDAKKKLDANGQKSIRQRVRLAFHTAVVLILACAAASSMAFAQQKSFSSPENFSSSL